jgi:hypothetical protein
MHCGLLPARRAIHKPIAWQLSPDAVRGQAMPPTPMGKSLAGKRTPRGGCVCLQHVTAPHSGLRDMTNFSTSSRAELRDVIESPTIET